MKQSILFTFFILFFLNSNAQQAFGVDLGFGIKGGLNFNKVIGDGIKNSYSTDPHLGAFIHLNKRRIGIQLEANWSQNVVTTDSTFYGIYKQYYNRAYDSLTIGSFKFSNIAIPILLNLKFSQKVWFQVGPQFLGNIGMADKSNILKSGTDIIKKNNYNMIAGIWLQFGGKAPLIRVNAGARLLIGLNNINSINTYEVWRNQMIQLHIGISY